MNESRYVDGLLPYYYGVCKTYLDPRQKYVGRTSSQMIGVAVSWVNKRRIFYEKTELLELLKLGLTKKGKTSNGHYFRLRVLRLGHLKISSF